MKLHLKFLLILVALPLLLWPQQPDSIIFKPSGEPVLQVFSNFSRSIGDEVTKTSFEVRRAYLGYNYHIHPHYSIKILLDIGSPLDDSPFSLLKRYAYFKTASLTYSRNALTVRAGIIDLLNVGLQEKYWDRRYIFKSFMDEYRFGPRADIGVNLAYELSNSFNIDFMLMNGEGYDQLQTDNNYKMAAGLTYKPLPWLTSRIYGEYSKKEVAETLLAFFAGFNINEKLTAGAEANFRFSEDFIENHNRFGYSAYASMVVWKKTKTFARYDWVSSNIPNDLQRPWNLGRDGSALIFGVEYELIDKVRLALNYQDWFPAANNLANKRGFYLNLEFRL